MSDQLPQPPVQNAEAPTQKPWYKKRWGIAAILLAVLIVIGALAPKDEKKEAETTASPTVSQAAASAAPEPTAVETTEAPVETTEPPQTPDVPVEYTSALKSAENYLSFMPMSKAGLFDQLTSEHGDKFTKEAAQYAVDNVQADWKEQALKAARNYQENMHMSPAKIRDQLVSEHGDKFTKEEAQYAVDNL